MDPTFNLNKDRAKRILRFVAENNVHDTIVHTEIKAELLDEELVELLAAAGIRVVEIGIQSTDPHVLKASNRPCDLAKLETNAALLNRAKIDMILQLIAGLPGDSYLGLKRSVDWCVLQRPASVVVFPFFLLPGTYFHKHCDEYGIKADPNPTYYVFESKGFGYAEILKGLDLGRQTTALYHSGFGLFLYFVARHWRVPGSEVVEHWGHWLTEKGCSHAELALSPPDYYRELRLFVATWCRETGLDAALAGEVLRYCHYMQRIKGAPAPGAIAGRGTPSNRMLLRKFRFTISSLVTTDELPTRQENHILFIRKEGAALSCVVPPVLRQILRRPETTAQGRIAAIDEHVANAGRASSPRL
jgi:hypothetical protein